MRIIQGGCGFVQFVNRRDAQMAMRQMQGVPVYRIRLRISWGDPTMRDESNVRGGHVRARGPFQNNNRQQRPQHGPQANNSWQHGRRANNGRHHGRQANHDWQHGRQAKNDWQHMPPNFISRPQPWYQQQPSAMTQGQRPVLHNNGWYPGQGPQHQYPNQPARPQEIRPQDTVPQDTVPQETVPQETVPQGTQNGQPFKLRPTAASWKAGREI